jgi:hypothetical protein
MGAHVYGRYSTDGKADSGGAYTVLEQLALGFTVYKVKGGLVYEHTHVG